MGGSGGNRPIAMAVAVLTRSVLAKTVATTATAMVVVVMAEAVVSKTARGVVVVKVT